LRVLDLFCGEGGASKGYSDAGFSVVGVDNEPRCISRYMTTTDKHVGSPAYLGDWQTGLTYWLSRVQVDLIHASPPCQKYSQSARLHPEIDYPDLIEPVRQVLKDTGIHYVIENVPEAPLIDPVYLCGSMFQLYAPWKGEIVGLDRRRGFETSFPVIAPLDCFCGDNRNVPVFGHGCPGNKSRSWLKGKGFSSLTQQLMQIDWMTRDGLTEAIPPVYSEYIGFSFQISTGQMVNIKNRSQKARHHQDKDVHFV